MLVTATWEQRLCMAQDTEHIYLQHGHIHEEKKKQ